VRGQAAGWGRTPTTSGSPGARSGCREACLQVGWGEGGEGPRRAGAGGVGRDGGVTRAPARPTSCDAAAGSRPGARRTLWEGGV
jgi:hypothetical protein